MRLFPSRGAALWAAAVIATVVLFTAACHLAYAQEAAPHIDQAAGPEVITAPANPRPGVYYLDYGSYRWNPTTYPVDGTMRIWGWSALNPADDIYNWTELDNWIADRKALGLGTGIMTTTYDGSSAGDIRSTPDFVINGNDAVIPATAKDCSTCAEYPHYVNYWKRSGYNSNFDYSPHDYLWTLSGNVSIVDGPDSGTNYAAKLGGVNNASGSLYHYEERIPAMPASLNGTQRVTIDASIYIDTADTAANDHLYMEIWDTSNNKLGGTQVDITNLGHTNKTWKVYTFDVSNFGTEKKIRVAFRVTTNGASVTTFYIDTIKLNVRHLIPKYHSNTYFDPYKKFIDALGARYKSNPDLQFVSFGTGVYGENQPTQSDAYPDNHFDHVVQNAGLTSQGWIDYINRVSDAHATAFNTALGQPPNRSVLVQYAPTYLSVQEREDTTDYAASKKVGLSSNFLSPDWTQAYKNDGTGLYDPLIKFLGQIPLSFEAYDSDLCNPVLSFWGMAHALDKHIDYLRADTALFRATDGSLTPDAAALDWAGNYLGKTAATTPRAWVIMREHRNPTMTTCRTGGVYYLSSSGTSVWPDLGNFEFYLKQVDTIAGGKTVAETNDKGVDSRYAKNPADGTARPDAGLGNCPTKSYREDLFGPNYPCFNQPYNPDLPALVGQNPDDYTDFYIPTDWTGEGKEAYTVRRTDQAASNPYMFFLIDDGYISGTETVEVTITVKYFDIGTDKWSLRYHSTSGEKIAGTITKMGSKTLKVATFTITDGRFANGLAGGSDFYLDSRNGTTNDGNEWVHMVEIEKRVGPAAAVVSITASGANALLSWAAVTKDGNGNPITVSRYDVWRGASPYFTPGGIPAGQVTGTSWTDMGALSANDARYYLVTAVDSSGRQGLASNRTGKFSFGLTH